MWSLIVLFATLTVIRDVCGCKGCVNLDEASFAKVLPRFEAVLVKFDVAFPYGDKHEVFTKFAAEVVNNNDLLLAEVGVKDYGEKDNEALAKRFGVTKDDYPAVKLFKKNTDAAIDYPTGLDFNLEGLRGFVRDHTDIYLGLPGCLERFDKLAAKFVANGHSDEYLNEAIDLEVLMNDKDKESAKTYIVIMKKIVESGKSFIAQEKERVAKLLKGKISTKKYSELQSRLNILRAFHVHNKDEL